MAKDRNYLIDSTADKLQEYILNSGLKVGDVIPKELELAESTGVSRPVIREALGRLKAKGMLEAKRKRGTVITSPDFPEIISTILHPSLMNSDTLRNLFEFRLSLEIGMADFIMQYKTPKDIEDLYRIVASQDPDPKSAVFSNVAHEIEFHGKLYQMTRNQTLLKFQELLLPIFNYVHQSELLRKAVPIDSVVTHKDLVQIIEKGNAAELSRAMRQHLDPHFRRLFY